MVRCPGCQRCPTWHAVEGRWFRFAVGAPSCDPGEKNVRGSARVSCSFVAGSGNVFGKRFLETFWQGRYSGLVEMQGLWALMLSTPAVKKKKREEKGNVREKKRKKYSATL